MTAANNALQCPCAMLIGDGRGSVKEAAQVWDARTGQLLTQPLRNEDFVTSAQFSPDGQRVLTASADGTARVWDVSPPLVPLPMWFLDWADLGVGRPFDPQRTDVAIPTLEQRQRQEGVDARTDSNFLTQLAKWCEADADNRTISPHSVFQNT